MELTQQELICQQISKELYKTPEGKPFLLTKGQCQIFQTIYGRTASRTCCITPTQYGKSESVAQAVLTRAATFPEKWTVVAPNDAKAKIIMGAIIGHIFDNPYTRNKFLIEKNESVDKIRHEKSKNRVTFKISGDRIGEVLILSAQASKQNNPIDALMGFGCIVAGDKILTNQGLINIEKVVDEKLDVLIASYNHEKEEVEWLKPLNYQKNKRGNRKLLKFIVNNKEFTCTEDHPIYVENKGYIPAKEVKENDVLWLYK